MITDNKCPHCGSAYDDSDGEPFMFPARFRCDSTIYDDYGNGDRSKLCLQRARANKLQDELTKALERVKELEDINNQLRLLV